MPMKKNPSRGGMIQSWTFTEDPDTPGTSGETVDIESSAALDGDVLVRASDVFWIRKDEIEDFITALREASRTKCDNCDGEGWV